MNEIKEMLERTTHEVGAGGIENITSTVKWSLSVQEQFMMKNTGLSHLPSLFIHHNQIHK